MREGSFLPPSPFGKSGKRVSLNQSRNVSGIVNAAAVWFIRIHISRMARHVRGRRHDIRVDRQTDRQTDGVENIDSEKQASPCKKKSLLPACLRGRVPSDENVYSKSQSAHTSPAHRSASRGQHQQQDGIDYEDESYFKRRPKTICYTDPRRLSTLDDTLAKCFLRPSIFPFTLRGCFPRELSTAGKQA
ncbi:hypothetical protein E2C01_025728 [Portunus trituberculatus]|uniref:Uncharacterized protein n=1 Tax=Portunus trituberculatus TaxID=210409 RepID=A0A5B7EG82_PORTR|nr:hypothetical protein [Portunus trituberculatus]